MLGADLVAALGCVAVIGAVTDVTPSAPFAGLMVAVWLVALTANRGYEARFGMAPSDRIRRVGRAAVVLALACWVLPDVAGEAAPARTFELLAALLVAAGLLSHLVLPMLAEQVGLRIGLRHQVLVVGHVDQVERAGRDLLRVRGAGRHLVTVTLDEQQDLADLDDFFDLVDRHDASVVVALPGPALSSAVLRRMSWGLTSRGVQLFVGTELLDVARARTSPVSLAGLHAVHLSGKAAGRPSRLAKELVERLLVLLVLVMLLPILLVIAVLVRRSSPGPAIFRQTRIGKDGQPFTMYKFRTMRPGSDADARDALDGLNDCDGVLFKMRQDPRVTPIGGVLRQYSLDELPQLVNVLLGHMSLVGPRPALPGEVARYDSDPRRRLVVKPGLTGLWQVSGRSELSWAESVRLDLAYVDNWSLGLDARILARTVRAVLSHDGAY
jgi:exopolysaccharide biosynthesis polyprenyl glycosylphosphotransferase